MNNSRVLAVFTGDGMTLEQYETLRAEVKWDTVEGKPEGIVLHAAASNSTGLKVCDVWESEALMNKFFETRLGPAMAKRGIPIPTADVRPLHTIITPGL